MDAAVPTEELGVLTSDGMPLSVAVEARFGRGLLDERDSGSSCREWNCARYRPASLLWRSKRFWESSLVDSSSDIVKSEKVRDCGRSTVGDRFGTMSADGMSKYDAGEVIRVGECTLCIGVCVKTSFFRHLVGVSESIR